MKKSEFLADVRHEVEMLKKNATEKELGKLDFEDLDPHNAKLCIYGQMTGRCSSERAKILMDKSCIRQMDLPNGTIDIAGRTFRDVNNGS